MAKHKIKIPNGTQIQTILFDKAYYPSVKQVKQWLHLWGFPLPGKNLHETEDNYRVRQGQPDNYELGSFRVFTVADGIKAIVGKKKNPISREKDTGKYTHSIDRICECGHRLGEHAAASTSTQRECFASDCSCERFRVMKKKVKKNSAVRLNPLNASSKKRLLNAALDIEAIVKQNPMHFPKSKAGRPRKRGRPSKAKHHKIFSRGRKPHVTWWVLDLYNRNDQRVKTLIGQGDKDQAKMEAQKFVKGSIYRVELCGPYYFKPSKDVVRK